MKKFAFVIHPLHPKDAARQLPFLKFLPDKLIEWLLIKIPPMKVSTIRGIRSSTGEEIEGYFIGCPLTPSQMIDKLPIEEVYRRLQRCTDIAHELGAEIIGLGAFTSIVGDGGKTIAERSKIPVTTGNSYTVATAIQGTLRACELLEIDPGISTLAVVGATGSIGKTCALVLAKKFEKVIVIGRDLEKTQAVADLMPNAVASIDVDDIREADAIVTVTSTDAAVIHPEVLKPGAIVCDVARPRDVSVRVAKERPDVLVIEGGIITVPGPVDFNFDFGFPKKTAYACMSETMLLTLEGRFENFSLGKDVTVEQVEQTIAMAEKHGFKLASFRSFEKEVDEMQIQRAKAARMKGLAVPRTAAAQ